MSFNAKKPNRVNTACERTVTSKQTTDKEDIQIYNYIYIFKNWFITTFDECVHNSTRSLIAFTIKLLISAIFNLYSSTTTKKWIKKRNRSPKRAQITKYYIDVLCSKKKETVEFKILKYFFYWMKSHRNLKANFSLWNENWIILVCRLCKQACWVRLLSLNNRRRINLTIRNV